MSDPIVEPAEKMLAEALERFEELSKLRHNNFGPPHNTDWLDCSTPGCSKDRRILAASPQLRDALELGLAWKAAEAALPDGWRMGSLRAVVGFNGHVASTVGWNASAYGPAIGEQPTDAYGATPTEALTALAALLRATEKEKP